MTFPVNELISVSVAIACHFVAPLTVDNITISLTVQRSLLRRQTSQQSHHSRHSSNSSLFSLNSYNRLYESIRTASLPLNVNEFVDNSSCGITCHCPSARVDSGLAAVREHAVGQRTDADIELVRDTCQLYPGHNVISLVSSVSNAALFSTQDNIV